MRSHRTTNIALVVMFALLALYILGLVLGWASSASWHLLIVVVAILVIYNFLSRRGT